MAGLGHARRLAEDLRRFFSAAEDRRLCVTDERAFPGGRELVVTDGLDTASLFLFDSGTIVIENDGKRVNYRLKQWEATVLADRG